MEFAGGTGDPNDPYQIATAEQLVSIGSDPNLLSRHFVLVEDIDLDPNLPGGRVFTQAVIAPDWQQPFTGSLDGAGHVIRNLVIKASDPDTGTFGTGLIGVMAWPLDVPRTVENRPVAKNLGLENISISGDVSVGGLVGDSLGASITRCYTTGVVTGRLYVGGLVGYSTDTISCSYSSAAVMGTEKYVGGLVGCSRGSRISVCYTTGPVGGGRYVGGLAGTDDSSIIHCYSISSVSGDADIGPLVGKSQGLDVDCFFLAPADGGGPDNGIGTPLTAGQMRQQASFSGWDFWGSGSDGSGDYWFMPADSYPVLSWQTDITGLRTVPTVAGFKRDSALVVLQRAGFSVQERQELYRTIPAGLVVRTTPSPDSLAPVDSNVVMLTSAGAYDWTTNPGDGTTEAPYQIETAAQLESLMGHPELQDKHFVLTADIDLDPNLRVVWPGPGVPFDRALIEVFSGTWNGRGHKITNLVINSPADTISLGLFGQITAVGVVQALAIEGGSIRNSDRYADGIYIGTLAGQNDGTILDCHVVADVNGTTDSHSYLNGGGLVGSNRGQISHCDATGVASGHCSYGTSSVGGLAGANSGAVDDCRAAVNVSGSAKGLGGLVGTNWGIAVSLPNPPSPPTRSLAVENGNSGIINDSCATGNVSGVAAYSGGLGGLVGSCNGGSISGCYATGSISSNMYGTAGGLVGDCSEAEIVDSYATGAVNDDRDSAGGLVAKNYRGLISRCYSTSVVSGYRAGGFAQSNSGDIVGCFWDTQTSGQTWSVAGTGLTTAQMHSASSFANAGWDFETVWMICEGKDYPRLRWEQVECDE